MKIIQISEKLYKDLISIAKEYVSKDNRYHARNEGYPFMFTVLSEEWVDCAEDLSDEYYWIDSYGDSYDHKQADAWCKDNNCYYDEDLERLISNSGEELKRRSRRLVENFAANGEIHPFFTTKACNEYIENNKDLKNNNARTYSFTLNRNFEIDTLAKLLIELGNHDN